MNILTFGIVIICLSVYNTSEIDDKDTRLIMMILEMYLFGEMILI